MIPIALGLGALGLLMWAARAFSRADVASLKALGVWVAALGGLALGTMLLLTGRGALAVGAAITLGPLVWSWWRDAHAAPEVGMGQVPPGKMGRAEALEVLGLQDPVSESEVRTAYMRLIRVAHPDGGGTHGLAARVNQARDVLLGRR